MCRPIIGTKDIMSQLKTIAAAAPAATPVGLEHHQEQVEGRDVHEHLEARGKAEPQVAPENTPASKPEGLEDARNAVAVDPD